MKRNPRKVKWTNAYRRVHGKDMTQDSTFECERKRNMPERYDRILTENVLKAVPMIVKIRDTRERRLHKKKFLFDSYLIEGNKKKVLREAQKELEQSIHMVKAPSAIQPEKIQVKVFQQQQENPLMEE